MKTRTLGLIAVLLGGVIAAFFVLAPKGGQKVAGETAAPVVAGSADAAAEAVPAPAADVDAAAAAAAGEVTQAVTAPDAAPAAETLPVATPQPDSFAVPPVDLDLQSGDTPGATQGGTAKPADPAPQPQP
jgi:hypothetical protein